MLGNRRAVVRFPAGARRFSRRQAEGSEAHHATHSTGAGGCVRSFTGVKRGDVRTTTRPSLVPRWRVSGAAPLFPYTPPWRAQANIYFAPTYTTLLLPSFLSHFCSVPFICPFYHPFRPSFLLRLYTRTAYQAMGRDPNLGRNAILRGSQNKNQHHNFTTHMLVFILLSHQHIAVAVSVQGFYFTLVLISDSCVQTTEPFA
jgi:hypothetical protein